MKSHYYLLSIIYALCSVPAFAGIRVGNASRSYASGYAQVNAQNAAAVQNDVTATDGATSTVELPIRVANANLANQIMRGDTTARATMDDLNSCANVYPNGEFAWDTPTAGRGAGGASACVAVVELRGYQMGVGGADAVLARANVATGDTVKCNISDFPEISYTADAGQVTFPADNAPTKDDVISVMNQEQKQNAGLKIAAGLVVGGLGGNIAGKNELGHDGVFGGGKDKITSTVVGSLAGGALMAGNAFGGKVAGDMILSTGVNAAAGGVVGNMAASGDSVLRVEDCKVGDSQTTCLWGMVVTGAELAGDKHAFFNISDGASAVVCDANNKNCRATELINIVLTAYTDKDLESASTDDFARVQSDLAYQFYLENGEIKSGQHGDGGIYTPIESASTMDKQVPALIPYFQDKAFGMRKKDWADWKSKHSNADIYGRASTGNASDKIADASLASFFPVYRTAADGNIIDLGNKARLKGTLIGAGTGGALGAFSAYQGAQSDIENRWASAVTEYKDSLQKFYCATGTRFLGFYNEEIPIPERQN